MTNILPENYWTDQFQVTQADLDRIAMHIHSAGQARDLTYLARRMVQGRLHHGQEESARVQLVWAQDTSVRLWDPTGDWVVGNHVIILTWRFTRKRNEPMVGEIVRTKDKVTIRVDDTYQPERQFKRAGKDTKNAQKWREVVENAVNEWRESDNFEEKIDLTILQHGDRVVGQLLDAMRGDERFVRLSGRWFLRKLAMPPSEEQLLTLAWKMVVLKEPTPTSELVTLVQPPLAEGDAGLFGLYLALRERKGLFTNADPGLRPRWVLAGPPPGEFTPRRAAFDPETYEILCIPKKPVLPETVDRLWKVNLLQAVI